MSTRSDTAVIVAASPMSGWVWPLSAAPDQAFATGVLGEGLCIDPLKGEVTAPFAGRILTLNASGHAVVIRHECGLELLVHVGIDTVALGGRGFEALVQAGDKVRAGQSLIRFDLDAAARAATSLVSPVINLTSDLFELIEGPEEREIDAGAPLMRFRARAAIHPSTEEGEAPVKHVGRLGLPYGLHARPAAAIARLARRHQVVGKLVAGERSAALGSVASMMALGLQPGDGFELQLSGMDAPTAEPLIRAILLGEYQEAPTRAAPSNLISQGAEPDPGVVCGMCGAPGLALGPAFHFQPLDGPIEAQGEGVEWEVLRLRRALQAAAAEISSAPPSGVMADVREAHLGLIEDVDIQRSALEGVQSGQSAGYAWREAVRAFADRFRATGDARLIERISDLRDVEHQVLRQLAPGSTAATLAAPEGAILLADDLSPSELSALAEQGVAGVCLARSGPTAHVAIIAAAMNLPLVTSAGAQILAVSDGQALILDAGQGRLVLSPTESQLDAARRQMADYANLAEQNRAQSGAPAVTRDGETIRIFANLGAAGEAAAAVASGAEGCGLLRTEFLFMDRMTAPSEDEQHLAYQAVLDGLEGRPLVIRTLDAGGDKPIAYLPNWKETNPALGMRGVRTSLAVPGLLDVQLRAILRVTPLDRVSIMVPMVNGPDELRRVRARIDLAATEFGLTATPPVGVMIETPAAVLGAAGLAREADFFSLGANDLTQYVLAMDRTSALLAKEADGLHPAVLKALAMSIEAARGGRCPVSVCGGLASDPAAIPLLIGLGVRSLSVAPPAIAAVKGLVRKLDVAASMELASLALQQDSAHQIRALVGAWLTGHGRGEIA